MKNLTIKLLSFLLSLLVLGACKKELNVLPTTSEVDGNVIVDATSASTVLNGVYYRFADAGVDVNKVPSLLWTQVNEVLPSELANGLNHAGFNDGVSNLLLVSQSPTAAYVW